jgi:predicted flap endonuclease-1-like 5' DNA nuclease
MSGEGSLLAGPGGLHVAASPSAVTGTGVLAPTGSFEVAGGVFVAVALLAWSAGGLALALRASRRTELYHRRSKYWLLAGAALAAVGAGLYVAHEDDLALAGFLLAAAGATVVIAQLTVLVTGVAPPGFDAGLRRYRRVGVLLATTATVGWLLPRAVDLPATGETFALTVTAGLGAVTVVEVVRRLRAGGLLPAAPVPPPPPLGRDDDDDPPPARAEAQPGQTDEASEGTDGDDGRQPSPTEAWDVPPGQGSVPPGSVGRDLQTVHGIGPRIARKLEGAGVDDVADLLTADPDALAEAVHGISAEQLREWQRAATGD